MDDLSDLNNGMAMERDDEEDIIELTDIVENDIDKESDKDDEIIELTSLVDDDSVDVSTDLDLSARDSDEPDFSEEFDFSEESDMEKSDLLDTSLDITEMEVDDSSHLKQPAQLDTDTPAGDLKITDMQLEAVLEKVIEKKFSEKIDSLLFKIVEKVVKKEIADIKKQLKEGITETDNSD